MAIVYLEIPDSCDAATSCQVVYLCLDSSWTTKTVSGIALLKATVLAVWPRSVEELCNSATVTDPCHPNRDINCCYTCVFHVSVDDSQIAIDPSTEQPYVLTADDVVEIMPYVCTVDKILGYISPPAETEDWVVDAANVSLVTDVPTGQWTFTIPIYDRLSGDPETSFDIEFNTSVLTLDVDDSSMIFYPGIGASVPVNFCDMIEGCMDGTSIIRNGDGTYSAVATVDVDDTASVDLTSTMGVLTADVKLDPDPSNAITITASGLLATQAALLVSDTNTVDLTLTGSTLEADVRLDPAGTNILTQSASGLLGTQTSITANDSNTIDFTASGTANHTITGSVKLDAAATNLLSSSASGLLGNLTAGTGIAITNPRTINVETSGTWGSGTLNFPGTSTGGMAIYEDSSGDLRTEPPYTAQSYAGGITATPGSDISTIGFDSAPSSLNVATVNITNSTRRDMVLLLSYQVFAQVVMQETGVWRYTGELSTNSGGAYTDIAVTQWGAILGAATLGMPWLMAGSVNLTLASGASIGVRLRQRIETLATSSAGSTWGSSGTSFQVLAVTE